MKKIGFILVVFIGLTILILKGCGSNEKEGTLSNKIRMMSKITREEVQLKDMVYTFEAIGTIEAEEEVQVPAKVGGIIDKVLFNEGDTVSTKTVLAEIDNERYSLEEKRAKAQLGLAKADYKNARDAYQRRLELKEKNAGWVTEEEIDTYLTNFEKAKSNNHRAKAEYDLAKKNLNDSRVCPPIAGVIDKKFISTGESVASDTTIAVIHNLSSLKLVFTVPETESGRIKVGQTVKFTIKSFPEKFYEAQIFFISNAADLKTRLVECKAKIQLVDSNLKPGFFANIHLETDHHQDAIVVPEEAVRATEKGFIVYTVISSGEEMMAKANIVKLGLRSQGLVEILSGLQRGDQIAVLGSDAINDGDRVEVVENVEGVKN